MSKLFRPITIDGVTIRNRFMRSATWDRTATDEGEVTDLSIDLIERLARGGAGLIVPGYAFVSESGKSALRQFSIAHDRFVPGLRLLVDAAHRHGAAIAAQIAHGGINLRLLGRTDRVALAPSHLDSYPAPHHEMTAEEVGGIVSDFGAAAARAKEAGFDAVQLHGAHGYLMSQFLSPYSNRRTDEWGGSPESRRRFHLEVLRTVRRAVGDSYPVWMKLGLRDYVDGGLTLEEGLEALRTLASQGLGAVEISAGHGSRAVQADGPEDKERSYFREESRAAKAAAGIPVMLVGGIRSLELSDDIVGSGDADMISMSRPFIREPGIIARWESGDTAPAKCISCAKCLAAGLRGGPLRCEEEHRLREEATGAAVS